MQAAYGVAARAVHPGDQHDARDCLHQRHSVAHCQRGWSVDDHEVALVLERADQLAHRVGADQCRGIRRRRTGSQHAQAPMSSGPSGQSISALSTGRCSASTRPSPTLVLSPSFAVAPPRRRSASTSTTSSPACARCQRETDSHRALALLFAGTRDQHALDLPVNREIGERCAKGLERLLVDRCGLDISVKGTRRDRGQQWKLGELLELVGRAQAPVGAVEQHHRAERQQDPDHQAEFGRRLGAGRLACSSAAGSSGRSC